MIEPAALTLSATTDLKLPPVTDIGRDEDLALLEKQVVAAEQAVDQSRYDDAIALLGDVPIAPAQYPDLALRALFAGSWSQMYRGELDEALTMLQTAKEVAHRPGFNDLDRAQVLCRIGAVRVKRGAISRAVNDLTLALELCTRSGRPCERLRAEIYDWRSRCCPASAGLHCRARRRRGCARAGRPRGQPDRLRRHQFPRLLDRRARRQVARRSHVCRAREGSLPAGRRPRERGSCPERSRRHHLPPRQAR